MHLLPGFNEIEFIILLYVTCVVLFQCIDSLSMVNKLVTFPYKFRPFSARD